jgi:hypothetical protein
MPGEIQALAQRLTQGARSPGARAVRLHDHVRDRIAYGVAPRVGAGTPEETLAAGIGDTLAKTALFVALLRAAGFRAFQHYVTIDRELLRGLLPHDAHRLLPWEIAHAYADVEIDGLWWSLDSYALDRPLWEAAMARLECDRAPLGYGVHRHGSCRWRGAGDAFAQLASPDMVVEDHGVLESLTALRHGRPMASPWSSLCGAAGDPLTALSAGSINAHLAALRASLRPSARDRLRIRIGALGV